MSDDVDTMKKVLALPPRSLVVYTKFIFSELMEAIEQVVRHSVVETLVLEGLPIRDCYALMFTNGLTENSSLRHLSFQRCNLGDDAAVEICQMLSSMMNLVSLDLSECNLSCRGAEAIANIIKAQKVHRYSIAWTDSLRYRDVNPDDFSGLRSLNVRNNPDMGDEGVKFISEVLCDDEWVKEIDMSNCGIGNSGAQSIIQCLNVNKTIVNFNIAQNYAISDQFQQHITQHLASSSSESNSSRCSLDSLDSEIPEKIQKSELLEKIKFLRYRYEVEKKKRQRLEELAEIQKDAMKQMEYQIMLQSALKIPEGFTLIDNDTFELLLSERLIAAPPTAMRTTAKFNRLKRPSYPRRVVSSKSMRARPVSIQKQTKSESQIASCSDKKIYFEQKIGDNCDEIGPSAVSTLKDESCTFELPIGDTNEYALRKQVDQAGDGSRPSTANTLIDEHPIGDTYCKSKDLSVHIA